MFKKLSACYIVLRKLCVNVRVSCTQTIIVNKTIYIRVICLFNTSCNQIVLRFNLAVPFINEIHFKIICCIIFQLINIPVELFNLGYSVHTVYCNYTMRKLWHKVLEPRSLYRTSKNQIRWFRCWEEWGYNC